MDLDLETQEVPEAQRARVAKQDLEEQEAPEVSRVQVAELDLEATEEPEVPRAQVAELDLEEQEGLEVEAEATATLSTVRYGYPTPYTLQPILCSAAFSRTNPISTIRFRIALSCGRSAHASKYLARPLAIPLTLGPSR